jgi:putative SOS response-associated peptidase YedK
MMRWGLLPYWAKDPAIAYSTFNARSEDIAEKPAFREPLKKRRCLVPADVFYEWQKREKKRQPFAIARRDKKPFCFAGLWDCWRAPDGLEVETFTVITIEANDLVTPLHNRMPVLLDPEDYAGWLAGDAGLLRSYPAEGMSCWKVNPAVGNVRNDRPGLCAEIKTEDATPLFPEPD